MSIYEYIIYFCLFISLSPIRNNKAIFFSLTFLLIIVAAIRGLSVGTDTATYFDIFSTINQPYSPYSHYNNTEYIFVLWNKLFHNVLNYDLYLISVYTLIVSLFSYVIYKYSTSKILSLFLLIALGYYTGSFNVMRQYIAMAIMLYGMTTLNDTTSNKPSYKFWILLLIAFFIHHSSLICTVLYFINKVSINKKIIIATVITTFIFGFFFSNHVSQYISQFTNLTNDYADYLLIYNEGERNLVANLGVNSIFLVTLFFSKQKTDSSIFMKSYFLYVCIFNLFGAMGFLGRVALYFAISQIIIIPCVLNEINKPSHKILYSIIIITYAICGFYMLTLRIDEILPYHIRYILW